MKEKIKFKGIILWHIDAMGTFKAFDIFIKKGNVRKYKKMFNWLYGIDCIFAKAFKEVFKDYVYIGSEDDLHAFPINLKIPKNFKVITLCTSYPDDIEKAKNEIKADLEKIKKEITKKDD